MLQQVTARIPLNTISFSSGYCYRQRTTS